MPSMRRVVLALVISIAGFAAQAADWPETRVGPQPGWDVAYDAARGARFIPMQLIVPGRWDGARRIELPASMNYTDIDGDRWSGPVTLDNIAGAGQKIIAFARERNNRREGYIGQHFAVRAEQDGLGRVTDSRFGDLTCAGEIKFPLGEWREGETRRNEYACASRGRPALGRVNVIVIEKLDFTCRGVPHCLQFRWTHWIEGRKEPDDDRRYIFAPGLGEVAHDRLR